MEQQQEDSETTKEIKEGKRMTVYQPTKKSTSNQKDIERGAEAVSTLIKPLVLMLLWNWLFTLLFGLPPIGYVKAFGLYLMSRILFDHKSITIDTDD